MSRGCGDISRKTQIPVPVNNWLYGEIREPEKNVTVQWESELSRQGSSSGESELSQQGSSSEISELSQNRSGKC